jgi:hypothetical protein
MSVVGLRSYEYQRATDLADKLQDLVARVEHDSEGKRHGTRQARLNLALQLGTLGELLDPLADDAAIHAEEALRLPVPMLRQLRNATVHGQPLRSALLSVVDRLRTQEALKADDIDVLHLVAASASSEVADAFERVVRR